MGANDLLILRAPDVNKKLAELNQRLGTDAALRDWFINDPARVIQKTIFPDQPVEAREINRGNRLLYALLSNERFMNWAREYQATLTGRAAEATRIQDPDEALRTYLTVVDRRIIHQDLVEAVANFADAEMVAGFSWRPDMVRTTPAPRIESDVAVDIETFIYAVAVAAVFAVAVIAVFVGVRPEVEGFDRIKLQNVANQLSERVTVRALELRRAGVLKDVNRRNLGFLR